MTISWSFFVSRTDMGILSISTNLRLYPVIFSLRSTASIPSAVDSSVARNKAKDFPKLPPCWIDVEITLKNGKKYKSFLASINNWGGVQFIINKTFKRIYLETEEVIKWEFI